MTQDLLTGGDNFQFDETKNYLEELVGEDKKFKDVDALAKGKAYADSMIDKMTAEQKQLREDYLSLRNEYNTRARLEDLVEKLSTQQPSSSNSNPQANEDRNKPDFDLTKLPELVSSEINKIEGQRKQDQNFREVQSKLTERFGTNYQNVLKSQIDELGITSSELTELARNNPKLLYKALKLDEEPTQDLFQAPPQSQRRSDNFSPSVKRRDWDFYEKMRLDKPDVYWDPKTQVQMHKDAQELGKAFGV